MDRHQDSKDKTLSPPPKAAPNLPQCWRTGFILFPFGDLPDKTAMGEKYKQLTVADVTYHQPADSSSARMMIVNLILFDDRRFVTLVFQHSDSATHYWWIKRNDDGHPDSAVGPFNTTLKVPAANFLREGANQAEPVQHWRTGLGDALHYVVKQTVPDTDTVFGSWFSYIRNHDIDRGVEAIPHRILNLGAYNPTHIPILGSYFAALGRTPQDWPADRLTDRAAYFRELVANCSEPPADANENFLGSQRELQRALEKYRHYSQHCSDKRLQEAAPGLSSGDHTPLPVWTERVKIHGWTIGQALKPFETHVYYDDSFVAAKDTKDSGSKKDSGTAKDQKEPGRQLSRFLNYSMDSTYKDGVRQDEYLEYHNTRIIEYKCDNGNWIGSCEQQLPGIGYPRANFPERMNSRVMGLLTGADYNIPDGRTLKLVASGEMKRPLPSAKHPNPTPVTASIFWWWFFEDDTGVFFSECDFATPQYHDLSIVDYSHFQRNAEKDEVDEHLKEPDCHFGTCPHAGTSSKW